MSERITEQVSRFTHAFAGIGAHCSIVQNSTGSFRELYIDMPALILVGHGEKRVLMPDTELSAGPGEIIVLPKSLRGTVLNRVARNGVYQADAFLIDPEVVTAYASLTLPPAKAPKKILPDRDLREALERAREALSPVRSVGDSLRRHILGEVVLRLDALGISLIPVRGEALADRVRSLVLQAPAEEWPAKRVSGALAVSEATLRRKLASSGTSLTDIVMDVRMTIAANMLQATELPVNRIALDVGYESASKFAARFRDRFGMSPRDIRSVEREIDRYGAENDQPSAAAE